MVLVACSAQEPTEEPEIVETATTVNTSAEEAEVIENVVEITDSEDDHDHDNTLTQVEGLDLDLFFDGALAEDVTIQDCTLSDGTKTTCYAITIAGYPADYDVGPFCPKTTASTAEDGGNLYYTSLSKEATEALDQVSKHESITQSIAEEHAD